MMPTEIIVISDTETSEPANDHYDSDDSEVVILSVSSPVPGPPSSQPSSASWGSVEDSSDSGAELPDAATLLDASRRRRIASQNSGTTSPQSGRSVSSTSGGRKRKSPVDSDSDDNLVEELPPARRRKTRTEEERAHERAKKEANKIAKQEEKRRRKEAALAEKTAERLMKKAHKDANRLVSDKKKTLKDMTIELSSSLLSSPLHPPLLAKMEEFGSSLAPITDEDAIVRNSLTSVATNLNALGVKLIRWKRRVTATYDQKSKQWLPLGENERYMRTEGTYMIFVTQKDVLRSPSITEQVRSVRTALGPNHHVHLMLCGWKPSRKEERQKIEQELVRLQVREDIFVEQVPSIDDAVDWIYNITADLGVKPHKLIERSHLPFCAVKSPIKAGNSDEDTMVRMLMQLPRLTEPAAKGIVREYKTINRVMEAYRKLEPEAGPKMLADVQINRAANDRKVLNNALSERLHSLLWGNDPKVLVN